MDCWSRRNKIFVDLTLGFGKPVMVKICLESCRRNHKSAYRIVSFVTPYRKNLTASIIIIMIIIILRRIGMIVHNQTNSKESRECAFPTGRSSS